MLSECFSFALSTSRMIFAAVESLYLFVTLASSTLFRLMLPLYRRSPSHTAMGSDSPVSAFMSTVPVPEVTTASTGIFSPGLSTMICPSSSSWGGTIFSVSPTFRFAYSGRISMKLAIDFFVLLSEISSTSFPAW